MVSAPLTHAMAMSRIPIRPHLALKSLQRSFLASTQLPVWAQRTPQASAAAQSRLLHASLAPLAQVSSSNQPHRKPKPLGVDESLSKRADFNQLDILGDVPESPTSVDRCLRDGFDLVGGAQIRDGDGVLLLNGEAFRWRPWVEKGDKKLIAKEGYWEVPRGAFGALGVVWPRPGECSSPTSHDLS